ncbi:hypothetical protein [Streptomyces sp. NPDC047928]|uniref:hypothetical protein n=1 Tax=unclassified Streptomyces TaxID=2593676 RepID=UPI00371676AF
MTATGTPFDADDGARAVRDLLARPVPDGGGTEWEPGSDEWTGSVGAGFRLALLWRSRHYFGVPGPEWDAAQDEAEAYLAELVAVLGKRWGPHRVVSMRPYLFGKVNGDPMPPLFAELAAFDLYGDLRVWGPLDTPHGPRWVGVSVAQCDEDAPHLMVGAVSALPLTSADDD